MSEEMGARREEGEGRGCKAGREVEGGDGDIVSVETSV